MDQILYSKYSDFCQYMLTSDYRHVKTSVNTEWYLSLWTDILWYAHQHVIDWQEVNIWICMWLSMQAVTTDNNQSICKYMNLQTRLILFHLTEAYMAGKKINCTNQQSLQRMNINELTQLVQTNKRSCLYVT